MQIPMTVTHLGSKSRVVAMPPDLAAYERTYSESIKKFGDELQSGEAELSRIFWLAWTTMRRTSKTALEYEAWLDGLEDCTLGEEEAKEPAPLETTPSPG